MMLAGLRWPGGGRLSPQSRQRGAAGTRLRPDHFLKKGGRAESIRAAFSLRAAAPLRELLSSHFARLGVDCYRVPGGMLEVKHRVQRAGKLIEGLVAQPAEAPVVLDKAQYRRQVG